MKHDLIKEYKNVRIRPIYECDLELLRNWRNNSTNTKYLSKIPYITKEMQVTWFKNIEDKEDEYVFAIEETDELKRCVGSFSIYNINNKNAEFGKILIGDEAAHGKKIAYNSIIAVLRICFYCFELDELYLHVYEENVAALKVYQQVGFVKVDEKNTEKGKELLMKYYKEQYKF